MERATDVESSQPAPLNAPLPDPIQFIRQEHEQQLQACSQLENLVSASDGDPTSEWAQSLLSYFNRSLPLHALDEELDLFPLLRARQQQDSNLGDVLDQLLMEHEADEELASLVISDLRALSDGRAVGHLSRFQTNVHFFCEAQRRHLNWENLVILPLAEKVLTQDDKDEMAKRILARRGSTT